VSFLFAAISAGLFAEFFASDIANFAAFFSSTAAMLAAILASDIANLAAFFSSAAAMSEAISSKVRLSYKIYKKFKLFCKLNECIYIKCNYHLLNL